MQSPLVCNDLADLINAQISEWVTRSVEGRDMVDAFSEWLLVHRVRRLLAGTTVDFWDMQFKFVTVLPYSVDADCAFGSHQTRQPTDL
jgi:hypothetical protein